MTDLRKASNSLGLSLRPPLPLPPTAVLLNNFVDLTPALSLCFLCVENRVLFSPRKRRGQADTIPSYERANFWQRVLPAIIGIRMATPDGKIGHAEVQIGDSRLKISDEYPELDFVGPQTIGGTSVTLHLYVEDVDEVAKNALAAGAKEIRPVQDEWYGDRSGMFLDPPSPCTKMCTWERPRGSNTSAP